ncbi:MAG: hypothetical protein DRP71_04640 [Verrucomicrobia bacterium]|nr:MAG: hypothetical protein DRP71_04640 [Verrucomicrobiota bacterium]
MKQTPQPYLIGVANVDVTPPAGSSLAGFAARIEPSNDVYLPLRCVITAITDRARSSTVLIVSIEWLGFYDNTDHVRRLISTATGIPTDHILLCGTHTHCGPPMRKKIDEDRHGSIDLEFIDRVFGDIARASAEAVASQKPTAVRAVSGWCGFAHSRRKPDGEGGIEWMPTLDAPHDHTVPVIIFEDDKGTPIHVLFSYACHPTSSGPILQIGGDYPGFAARKIEETFNCSSAFLLGCAGDQKPYIPDPGRPAFPMYPIEAIRGLGEQLAASVANAIRFGNSVPVTGPLTVLSRKLILRNEVMPRQVYESSLKAEQLFEQRWARHTLAILDRDKSPDRDLPFEIQALQFGQDLLLVALAGEMSAEYGLRLVRELSHRFSFVWPIAYANEIVGYVPVERQYSEGGYEVLVNMQYLLRPGPLERDSEERIFDTIGEILVD